MFMSESHQCAAYFATDDDDQPVSLVSELKYQILTNDWVYIRGYYNECGLTYVGLPEPAGALIARGSVKSKIRCLTATCKQ